VIDIVIPLLAVLGLIAPGLALWHALFGPASRPLLRLARFASLFLLAGLLVAWLTWRLSNAWTFQLLGGLVSHVETSEPVVALTFDDGPSDRRTEEVLAILRDHGVRATFFVTGRALARKPETGRRIVEEGHELGNHSFSHRRMVLKPLSFIRDEIERTDGQIRAAGYVGPIHFRAPGGKKLVALPYYLWRASRLNIFWDVAPEGYEGAASDAKVIVERVLAETRPGSIILLHVMAEGRATSRQALPGIIQGLQQRGYRFVTVSELLAAQ
jgi:chitin deacetylase